MGIISYALMTYMLTAIVSVMIVAVIVVVGKATSKFETKKERKQ
jgi:hypothetical protein